MKIDLKSKPAILFARIWGVIAILFGLFFIVIAIDNLVRQGLSTYTILFNLALLAFAVLFILAGRFFLLTKMSDK